MIKILFVIFISVVLPANSTRDAVVGKLIKESTASKKLLKKMESRIAKSERKIINLEKELEGIKFLKSEVRIGKNAITKEHKRNLLSDKENKEEIVTHLVVKKQPMTNKSIVVTWSLNARRLANITSPITHYYKMGEIVSVISEKDGWSQTKDGYLKSLFIKHLPDEKSIKVQSKMDGVNIRKSPYISKSNIVRELKNNEIITVHNTLFYKKWYKIINRDEFVYFGSVKRKR